MAAVEQAVAERTLVRKVLELLPESGILVLVHADDVLVERTDWYGRPDK